MRQCKVMVSARVMQVMAVLVMGLLVGCDDGPPDRVLATLTGAAVVREEDPAQIRRGEAVYRQHCAGCHGRQAEGDPQWRRRGDDGFYPPPPLNGSGHAWHHPKAMLRDMIRNGSPPGEGRMPAWGDTLSDEEIDAVIAWFQSLWPDPVYAAWYDREQRFLK